jgi:hypothetical protein
MDQSTMQYITLQLFEQNNTMHYIKYNTIQCNRLPGLIGMIRMVHPSYIALGAPSGARDKTNTL